MGKWAKLILICAGLWFFFAVLTPVIEPLIPAWQKYNRVQEEQDLDSGALYYSNVPQTADSEIGTREAVEEGMKARREARRKEREKNQGR